jgi:hypothetical protein
MTAEQVQELGSALEILSAKSSVIKERTELRKLIEENEKTELEEVRLFPPSPSCRHELTRLLPTHRADNRTLSTSVSSLS